ncbi:MAG TPA: ABC transporter substrate-binding protein, partial [Stellaceae bacterium]|nr:ABC transporter substrate-binding protein [Stellaceae bacterium]
MMRCRLAALVALAATILAADVHAQDATPAATPATPVTIRIAYLGQHFVPKLPSSFMEAPPQDDGIAGARLGIVDNNTTGRFTGQSFALDEQVIEGEGDVAAAFRKLVQDDYRLVVADLPAATLLAIADLPEAKAALLLNVAAREDALRGESCRANILHLIPSRAMLADALVQYLVLKRWRNVLLVPGPSEADKEYAGAVER